MEKKSIGAEAAKLAGLQVDHLQKLRSGELTPKQWERFLNLSIADREKALDWIDKDKASRVPVIKIWKTIETLSEPKTNAEWIEKLRSVDGTATFQITKDAEEVFKNLPFRTFTRPKNDLVFLRVFDLGFKKETRLSRIYDKAKKLGLELCPTSSVFQIREEFGIQRCGNPSFVATLIGPTDSCLYLPALQAYGSSWNLCIRIHQTSMDSCYKPSSNFIFVCPPELPRETVYRL